MEKIKMTTPIVEMDGDEMTRVLWQMIKDELLTPFVELNTEYYDLGLVHRDETDDQVTVDAGNAIKKYHVGVKCATITPNAQRMDEYHLKKMWKSPNGTIRGILDGTVFRTPIPTPGIKTYIPSWTSPITVARHGYGDIYKDTEMRVTEPGVAELVFTGESGKVMRETIYNFECGGVLQGAYNKDTSIISFARSCFEFALAEKKDLWFSTKDTIMKKYDGFFKSMIWALKNYDGDVMSDMISTAFGSLAMMTSVLVSADGNYEYEAAHGTVTRHYYRYLKGEKTSTNPVATIFAWSGALKKRGEFDGNERLTQFGQFLEDATMETIADGVVTGDLAALMDPKPQSVTSEEFIGGIRERLAKKLGC